MRPPAEINAEVVLPSGDRIRWDAAHPDPKMRPLSPQFESEDGKGFGAGSVALRRPSSRTYPELGLLNELILRTGTGRVVYQGRAQGIPSGDEWVFDCDGWWSHGEQQQMTEVLIDRDLNAWQAPSRSRESSLRPTYQPVTGPNVIRDSSNGLPAVQLVLAPHGAGNISVAEAWYDAGSSRVAGIYYDMTSTSASTDLGRWAAANNDAASGQQLGSDLLTGTNSSSVSTHTPATPARHAFFTLWDTTTATTADKLVTLRKLAVIGNHGIPTVTHPDGPPAITASEGIKYLANKYAPKWDTSGVVGTTYPIPHAVWKEPTTPGDAIRQLNSYHLWKLGVFEDRKLVYEPYDLSVADWQVAAGQDGCRVEYQGDTTENIFNGCAVTYTDFAGITQRITPDDTATLQDTGEWIAANQWGDKAWMEINLSWPTTADDAAQIGAVALAAANAARRPSTITVPMHIRDINGTWNPSSYVRAGQTIVVTNQHTPVPRLITRTSWSNHTLTISTDNALDTIGAFNARVGGALTAQGLI